MTNEPRALALLEATRRNLKQRVVPALSGPDRYEALLAMSAIGIVTRELEDVAERTRTEASAIASLLNLEASEAESLANDQALAALEVRLAESIRNGDFSTPEDTRHLLDYLGASCHRTLALTNPKVAEGYDVTGARKPD